METISRLATLYDSTPRTDGTLQTLPALTMVVHITGRATYIHAEKAKIPPLRQLGRSFDKPGECYTHYAVDPWGRVMCYAREDRTPWGQGWGAYHGKGGLLDRLAKKRLRIPGWWKDAWAELTSPWTGQPITSPVDLLPPKTNTPNERSVCIELIQWGNQLKITLAQYKACHALLSDIGFRHQIPLSRPYVRGHEDVDPWGRGNSKGGWDPGAWKVNGKPDFSWAYLLDPVGIPADGDIVVPTPEMPAWAV